MIFQKMRGDRIYYMGGRIDLGHKAEFIRSNKTEGKVYGHQ